MLRKVIQIVLPFENVIYAVTALVLIAAFFSGSPALAVLTLALVVGGGGSLAVAVARSGISLSQMRELERQRRLKAESRAAQAARGEIIKNALALALTDVLGLDFTPDLHGKFAAFGYVFGFPLGTRALADLDAQRLLTGVQTFVPAADICDVRVRERPDRGFAIIEVHTADQLAGVRGAR
ncbi:hypothetical protein [Trueperella sp. LYQ141]|uniref:hypothetical protein n=1 Tax=Trueperella sp. LYQ141 TaxID=3391058 RepID=UPI003982F113